MSIEDHLLDLVKGAKAMTESMVMTVEKVVEEIRKDKPAAEGAKVDRGGVYALKNYPGPLFRYREKIYRRDNVSSMLSRKVCGIMGSEWVQGVWAVSVADGERFLFLEDTEVVAVV